MNAIRNRTWKRTKKNKRKTFGNYDERPNGEIEKNRWCSDALRSMLWLLPLPLYASHNVSMWEWFIFKRLCPGLFRQSLLLQPLSLPLMLIRVLVLCIFIAERCLIIIWLFALIASLINLWHVTSCHNIELLDILVNDMYPIFINTSLGSTLHSSTNFMRFASKLFENGVLLKSPIN